MHADISLTLMKRNLLVSIKIRRQPPQTPLLKDVLMFDSLWEHSAAVLSYMAVGFGAQMVDGALGMAFGVISNTLLLTLGVPPAAASAGVHTVEAFTTGISGISHVLHRNVDWKMFARLLIPGLIGGIAGAYLLSNIDGSVIKPFVLAYLISIGLWLIRTEELTSVLQSLIRISYAVFCLKKKKKNTSLKHDTGTIIQRHDNRT